MRIDKPASYIRNLILLFAFFVFSSAEAQIIKVSYTSNAVNNFSGKVYLYLSKESLEPKEGPSGMEFSPCYSIAVKNIKPGQAVVFDDMAISFPVALSEIERGQYYVQAVWDRNLGGRAIGSSPGNIYNRSLKINFSKNFFENFSINCTEINDDRSFKETPATKELKVSSKLLSIFYQQPVNFNAAVILPKEYYEDSMRRFPVVFHEIGRAHV